MVIKNAEFGADFESIKKIQKSLHNKVENFCTN